MNESDAKVLRALESVCREEKVAVVSELVAKTGLSSPTVRIALHRLRSGGAATLIQKTNRLGLWYSEVDAE